MTLRKSHLIFAALATLAVPALATPADMIAVRVAGFKGVGRAFKQVNDGLRGGSLSPQVGQGSAAVLARAVKAQYTWFPAGSGPQSGVKTAAKSAIWSRAADFRRAQDAFAGQVFAFQRAAATGNADVIRVEARKLGATCKQCHDTFREADD